MQKFAVDLHIHTALSPCAEEEMTPPAVLARAAANGLRIIAITDHNSACNTPAFVEAAAGGPVTVIPGMEVQTREEVHLVCLFAEPEEALAWQEVVYAHLPPLKNNERVFGTQQLLNAAGEVTGIEERLLLASTDFSVEEVVAGVHARHGICYPAHVDRPAFSIIGSLGFIPPDLQIPVVEISRNINRKRALEKFPFLERYHLLGSSDAHRLDEISQVRTRIGLKEPAFEALAEALWDRSQNRIEVD
ncbi:MAG: PHP domain-containing protein [Bacillota bacterium]|nr:PHP domain-containing protein [Bacillota bacterium]